MSCGKETKPPALPRGSCLCLSTPQQVRAAPSVFSWRRPVTQNVAVSWVYPGPNGVELEFEECDTASSKAMQTEEMRRSVCVGRNREG